MAKQFYTPEETTEKLGISKEQLKQLVQEGKLRELHEVGNKVFYMINQVDSLADQMHGSDMGEIRLSPKDTGSDTGLAPENASGEIGLSPLDSGSGELSLAGDEDNLDLATPADSDGDIQLAPTESGSMDGFGLDDTDKQPAADGTSDASTGPIRLSPMDSADQVNLDDSTEPEGSKDDTVLTSHGVNVLDDSDGDRDIFADPLAQTQIAPDLADQVQLDSGSSGSGLLDLTREADDTSLGAELLEEIYPGTDQEGAIETQVPTGLDVMTDESSSIMATASQTEPLVSYARAVEVYDPASLAYGFALIVPLVFLFYLACIAAAGSLGIYPSFLALLAKYSWFVLGGGLIATFAFWGISLLATKPSTGPAKPKARKAKPEKKAKAPKKKK